MIREITFYELASSMWFFHGRVISMWLFFVTVSFIVFWRIREARAIAALGPPLAACSAGLAIMTYTAHDLYSHHLSNIDVPGSAMSACVLMHCIGLGCGGCMWLWHVIAVEAARLTERKKRKGTGG